MRIITLTTDFGLKDPYVAQMKAVILRICPEAKIVDITHEVEPQNIMQAAFLLKVTYHWFPENSIHVVVVDPGVGTARRPIVIRTRRYWFVGPDNGVLYPAAASDGIKATYEITKKFWKPSHTFHGRDIFAPTAAYIAKGGKLNIILREIPLNTIVKLEISKPKIRAGVIEGLILHSDNFGNLITNIREEDLANIGIKVGDLLQLSFKDKSIKIPFLKTFGDVSRGKTLCFIDSYGHLEIAVNMGSARQVLGLKPGDKITLTKFS